jgi:PAS domain S-box-containing protein
MKNSKPTYEELEARLAVAEPIVDALKSLEVDAVIGKQKLTFLLLKEIGDELLHSQAGFRAMFDLPGVGMIQADSPSFRFTKINEKFCEMTGFSADELQSKTYVELTDPRDRLLDMKALARMIRGKADSWSIEKRCIRKDGSMIWVGVNGTARRDDNGRVVRILAMVSDITADKQARLELRGRSERLEELSRLLQDAQRLVDESAGKPTKLRSKRR